ncbi:MAG TPA: LLM class flavin-dependent oxidoreductase [Ornithinibacter sp.]|nr:LLM class flavin-dependent oxidoreductase [Ornithinibacter sp.]
MTPSLGVVLVPTLPPEALRPLAAAADEHLDELWVWEDCFKESGIAAAAAALAWTTQVRVGIGLAPVPLRNVALLAMEIATLHRLFPGRLLPGIGHGVQDWMGQVGARVESPLTLLREHAEALRLLLDGHEVSVSGRYVHLDAVKLDWPPPPGTPLLIGGGGPRTLELAGRYGDGILIGSAVSEEELEASVTAAQSGWAAGEGADGARMPVLTHLIAATGPGARRRLDDELRRWGHADGAPGRGVAGDAPTVADAVRRLAALGASTVVFQPTQDEPDLDGFVEFVGRDVRAALAR